MRCTGDDRLVRLHVEAQRSDLAIQASVTSLGATSPRRLWLFVAGIVNGARDLRPGALEHRAQPFAPTRGGVFQPWHA
jgi:hypothetical protein